MSGTQPEMQFLRMAREASWGGGYAALTDAWKGISVPVGGYTLSPANTVDRPRKSEGTVQQTRARRTEMAVRGQIRPQVFPTLAQWIFDAMTYRDANGGMYSYVGQWGTPSVETRQHVGIMIDRARIECRTGTELNLSWDVICKNEEGLEDSIADFAVPSYPTAVAYYFLDLANAGAFLKYNDGTVDTIRGFSIEIANNLDPGPFKGDPPILSSLKPGAQDVKLEITDELINTSYRRDVRDFRTATFDAKFVHPTGASIRIYLPLIEADESPDDHQNIVLTNPKYTARKPAGADQIQITIADAS